MGESLGYLFDVASRRYVQENGRRTTEPIGRICLTRAIRIYSTEGEGILASCSGRSRVSIRPISLTIAFTRQDSWTGSAFAFAAVTGWTIWRSQKAHETLEGVFSYMVGDWDV